MPRRTSTPLTKTWTTITTDPGSARAGKAGLTLALKKTDFGPCKHDPSNTIFSSRTRDGEGGKRGLKCSGEKRLVCRTKLKNLNDRLTKPALLFSWTL